MSPSPNLVLIILAVRELSRSAAFYREVFDWPVRVEVPVYVEMETSCGQRVGLYEREGFARNTGLPATSISEGHTSSSELYFHAADPEPVMQRLQRAGAQQLSPLAPRPWGDMAAYFADPDGNVIVVARPQLNPRSAH